MSKDILMCFDEVAGEKSMMKWRVRKESNCSYDESEDVRRSLEVLDSVLAEFDDTSDSWDFTDQPDHRGYRESLSEFKKKPDAYQPCSLEYNEELEWTPKNCRSVRILHIQENGKINTPPPIPQRSPHTKLSDSTLSVFNFSPEDISLNNRISSQAGCCALSPKSQKISKRLSPNGDGSRHNVPDGERCGCERRPRMDSDRNDSTPEGSLSPFLQARRFFEASGQDADSPSLEPYAKGSKQKKVDCDYNNLSDSVFSEIESSGNPNEAVDSIERGGLRDLAGDVADSVNVVSSPSIKHSPNCRCVERLRQLDAKFADVREKLRLNLIEGLDEDPPNFIPDSPPRSPKKLSDSSSQSGSSRIGDGFRLCKGDDVGSSSSTCSLDPDSLNDSFVLNRSAYLSDSPSFQASGLSRKFLSSNDLYQSYEYLPDVHSQVVNRPDLRLSYSLEEDLPPGVKEIQRTSTPKSDVSPSLSFFRAKDTSLSTFSHSASSLGYVSSQSDLELNNMPVTPDKVPLSAFKSVTLPYSTERSPFYSPVDEDDSYSLDLESSHRSDKLNGTKKPEYLSQGDLKTVPSSPHAQKKKRSLFGFSMKGKKDKYRNGPTPAS